LDQSLRPTDPSLSPAGLGTSPPTEGGGIPDFEVNLVSLNQWQIAWRRFLRHRLAVFGSLLFLFIVVCAIVLPFFFPFDFYKVPTPVAHCPGAPTSLGVQWLPAHAPAPVRDDRWAAARRLFGRRQRRPPVAHHRLSGRRSLRPSSERP